MLPHSVPVPRLYKLAAKVIENIDKTGESIKSTIYKVKHPNTKALYALIVETLKHSKQLEFLLKRTKLLETETRFNPWLAKVLITELLWGKKHLVGECKPIKTILAYQQVLNAHASDVHENLPTENKVRKPRFVRVNTLLVSIKDAIDGFRDEGWTFVRYTDTQNYDGFLDKVANLSEYEFMVDIHIPEVLIFPSNTEFYAHHAYKNGMIILQDKASCLCGHLLNPPPGSAVLDMCAAPGMKTSHLAAKLNNEGKVYAVDLDDKRLKALELLMEKNGITCVQTINKDVLKVTNSNCPEVKYILVDPSCSGSGIVNRLDLIKPTIKDDNRITKLRGFQIMILKHAFRRFPNAQRVIYSTCSLYPEENEEVVAEVLSQITKFKLINAAELINTPWHNFGSEKYGNIGKFCLYSRPEKDFTNGFFVAIFERLADDEVNEYYVENTNFQNTSTSKSNKENKNEISTAVEEDGITNIPDSESKTKKKKKKKREANNADEIKEDFLEAQTHHEKLLSSTVSKIEKHKEVNFWQQNTKKKKKRTKENLNDTMEEKAHNIEDNDEEDGITEIPKSESKTKKKKKKWEVNNTGEMKEDLLEAQTQHEESLSAREIEIEKDKDWQQNKKKKREKEHLKDTMEEKAHNIDDTVEEDGNTEVAESESKRKKKKRVASNVDEMKEDFLEAQTDHEMSFSSTEIVVEKDKEENSWQQNNKKKKRKKKHLNDTMEEKAHLIEDTIHNIPKETKKKKKKTHHHLENDVDKEINTENELKNVDKNLLTENNFIIKDDDFIIKDDDILEKKKQRKHKSKDLADTPSEKLDVNANMEVLHGDKSKISKSKKKQLEMKNSKTEVLDVQEVLLDVQEVFEKKKRKKRIENVAFISDIESDKLSNLLIFEANNRLDNMIKKNEEMEISENKNNENRMRTANYRNERVVENEENLIGDAHISNKRKKEECKLDDSKNEILNIGNHIFENIAETEFQRRKKKNHKKSKSILDEDKSIHDATVDAADGM